MSERPTPHDRASLLQDRIHEDSGAVRAGRTARSCTCHPDDITSPCERKYALGDCRISRLERQRDEKLKNAYDYCCENPRDAAQAMVWLEEEREELIEALRICRGVVDAYGQPETKERLDAILARIDGEKPKVTT